MEQAKGSLCSIGLNNKNNKDISVILFKDLSLKTITLEILKGY